MSDVAAAYSACPTVSSAKESDNVVVVEFEKDSDGFGNSLKTVIAGLLKLRTQSSILEQGAEVCIRTRLTTYESQHREAAPISFSPVTLQFHVTSTSITCSHENPKTTEPVADGFHRTGRYPECAHFKLYDNGSPGKHTSIYWSTVSTGASGIAMESMSGRTWPGRPDFRRSRFRKDSADRRIRCWPLVSR